MQIIFSVTVICDKYRRRANEVSGMTVIGDVQGRDVILVDDLVDTAGTLCKAADALVQRRSQRAGGCTSGVVGKARPLRLQLQELIVTDTLPLRPSRIKLLSSAKLFAHAIREYDTGLFRRCFWGLGREHRA
jgi:ribose-phosphate pyrophosphokinase